MLLRTSNSSPFKSLPSRLFEFFPDNPRWSRFYFLILQQRCKFLFDHGQSGCLDDRSFQHGSPLRDHVGQPSTRVGVAREGTWSSYSSLHDFFTKLDVIHWSPRISSSYF